MSLIFVLGSAAVAVFWSEKAYWYVQGWSFAELVLVYALPTAVTLWVLDRVAAGGWRTAILAGAVFALIAEGVITPIVYEDGPLPLLAAYFVGWHGVGSIALLWYGFRRFLLAGQTPRLALASLACGVVFGIWSLSWWLPESAADADLIEEGFDFGRWSVGRFALYAVVFSVALALAHLALGFVWQRRFAPSRLGVAVVAAGLGIFAIPTLIAIPWAPLKLGVLLLLVALGLRRVARRPGPTILEELDGRFPPRRLWPLVLLPVSAIAVYASAVALEPSQTAIRTVSACMTAAVTFIGAGAVVLAVVGAPSAGARSPQS